MCAKLFLFVANLSLHMDHYLGGQPEINVKKEPVNEVTK